MVDHLSALSRNLSPTRLSRRSAPFDSDDYIFELKIDSFWALTYIENGQSLFEKVCGLDLEGIVCKQKDSPYKVTEKPSRYWIKVKNPRYSQLEGREEFFERTWAPKNRRALQRFRGFDRGVKSRNLLTRAGSNTCYIFSAFRVA
jgi:hypothetical protein